MILPLCHLYEFQDEKTCEMFDFPVVLSGHDHHKVDRSVRTVKSNKIIQLFNKRWRTTF